MSRATTVSRAALVTAVAAGLLAGGAAVAVDCGLRKWPLHYCTSPVACTEYGIDCQAEPIVLTDVRPCSTEPNSISDSCLNDGPQGQSCTVDYNNLQDCYISHICTLQAGQCRETIYRCLESDGNGGYQVMRSLHGTAVEFTPPNCGSGSM